MTLEEIKDSGLLELYAMGSLSQAEAREVEQYMVDYPELKVLYQDIQAALQAYAKYQEVTPRVGLESDILKYVKDNSSSSSIGGDNTSKQDVPSAAKSNWVFPFFLSLLTLGALYLWYSTKTKLDTLETQYGSLVESCDSTSLAQQNEIDRYSTLFAPQTRQIPLAPTEGYPETNLLFYINPDTKENYIQVKNLPAINRDQAFQLWSLKEGQDPIPLTVFKQGEAIIPVDYEEGTATYAITIEREEGVLVPTLSRLIGTVGV